jgi:hypothetical protein
LPRLYFVETPSGQRVLVAATQSSGPEEVARRQASAEQAWQNEQVARQRWVDSQEEAIRSLTAGQSEANVRAIEAQFAALKSS